MQCFLKQAILLLDFNELRLVSLTQFKTIKTDLGTWRHPVLDWTQAQSVKGKITPIHEVMELRTG